MPVVEQARRTVVVLGGYGKAGAAVAHQLHGLAPDIHIVVAGRRIGEAERTARRVDNDVSGRVTAARVDIASASELDDVLAGADLCVAALPGSAVTAGLVEAVIRNRVHYLDLSPSSHLDPYFDQRVSNVEQAGVAIMRQAGLLPGSAAAVARYAASLIAEPVSVQVDTFLHDPDIPDAGIADLFRGSSNQTGTLPAGAMACRLAGRHRMASLGSAASSPEPRRRSHQEWSWSCGEWFPSRRPQLSNLLRSGHSAGQADA